MKFILALFGLGLFAAGVYFSLDTFQSFMTLEPTQIALMLGLSLVAMVLGLYFVLSLFVSKKSSASNIIEEEVLSLTDHESNEDFEEAKQEDETDSTVFKLDEYVEAQANLNLEDQAHVFQSLDLKPETVFMPILKETPQEENTLETIIDAMESKQTTEESDTTTDTLKGFFEDESGSVLEDEVTKHTQEARLIGIEPWGVQRLLKRIKAGDEVQLKMNAKHGLRSAEIFYDHKSIGYLSKVDFNKIEHDLPNLLRIEVATIISETKTVDLVILRLIFKNN